MLTATLPKAAAKASKMSPYTSALAPLVKYGASKVGSRISKLIGSGSYKFSNKVATNSLFPSMSRGSSGPTSSFGTPLDGMRVRHRDFIQDISATANTFTTTSFPINPGIADSFPYLSNLAANFECYKFHGLVYEFISSSTNYSSGGGNLGTTIIAAEYDPLLTDYSSKTNMENSDYAISARIDDSIMYGFECSPKALSQNMYYVRNGFSNLPITTTDVGNLIIASSGTSASAVIGELWVSYDIEFFRPRIIDQNGPLRAKLIRNSYANATPFATPSAQSTSYSNGLLMAVDATGLILTITGHLMSDYIEVTFSWQGSTAAAITLPTFAVVGGNLPNNIYPTSAPALTSNNETPQGTITGLSEVSFKFMIVATAQTITITAGTAGVLPSATKCVELCAIDLGGSGWV
jgi:hypothetical protein